MSFLALANPEFIAATFIAQHFCFEFCKDNGRLKYILGRNIYSECVIKQIRLNGIVDDYTPDKDYRGLPVIRISDVPRGALVLNVAGGRPLSAKKKLDQAGLENLDYFSFFKFSGLSLIEMKFNEGFKVEFSENKNQYEWIYDLLEDEESRVAFRKLVSFRLSYDIENLSGFSWREDVQYFEDFLNLKEDGETFIDVGGFDGFTSLEFIKRAPNYRAIHVFEPAPENFQNCLASLKAYRDIKFHNFGLSDAKAKLKIDVQGSGSKVSENGTISVKVDMLDDVLMPSEIPTFIKMDIEGGEMAALAGSRIAIMNHHPRLAISVYHKPGDFWRIARLILSIRDDYKIYLRHYTESIYESVMFFLPKK